MFDGAIDWAESVLDSPVRECVELSGGITSTMLALEDAAGGQSVLRLMTNEPWRTHGPVLTTREQSAQRALAATPVPAPVTLGLDADGQVAGVSAHLMSRLVGEPTVRVDASALVLMTNMLATIHDVHPTESFRPFQSWAWEAKWVIPAWTKQPASWQRAFDMLAEEPPTFDPTFLHRDFSHRNLLWDCGELCGVVDWVETSIGPAWLDAGHAATNLALAFGPEPAKTLVESYAAATGSRPDSYWLIMDAVGFLPPPGMQPMFGSATELARLDGWLHDLIAQQVFR